MKVIAYVATKKEIELPDEMFYEDEFWDGYGTPYRLKDEHAKQILGEQADGTEVFAIYDTEENVIAEW